MRKIFLIILAAMVLSMNSVQKGFAAMEISSPDFEADGMIPARFTCQGEEISPALKIVNIPEETQSLALIVDDPDAPSKTWVHWVVYDMKINGVIGQGEVPGVQGSNDFGQLNYGGPCPPGGTHRYFFKVYALDKKLGLGEGLSKEGLIAAMEGHILDQAVLMGLYKKK
ncbi:MAG: YbhB/YbcL family Raf kinase inhibitor-like protein [Candidatus Omnitrophota bacterium]